jgi:hypothetical protein
MEQRAARVKPPWRATMSLEQLDLNYVKKNAAFMERTPVRHLTPEEIALNQQEITCSSEIELLEMQEKSLESELERDIDETRRMIIIQTLRILYKALLIQHRDLARIKNAQITSLQRSLRSYA